MLFNFLKPEFNNYKFNSCLTENTFISITKTDLLSLFREIIAVYCDNHTKHINT
jgi:hypothetical protein